MTDQQSVYDAWRALVDAQIGRLLTPPIISIDAPYADYFTRGLSPMHAAMMAIDYDLEEH